MTASVRVSTPATVDIERLRGQGDSPEAVREAAREFEALLIGKILQSLQAGASWLGEEGTEFGGLMLEMAQQQLARALAAQGGLGLSDTIVAGLSASREDGQTTRQGPGSGAVSEGSAGRDKSLGGYRAQGGASWR